MALYGTGSASNYWRSPPRDMPAQGGRPIWISLWLRSPNVTGAAGLAAFQFSAGGSASVGPYTSGAVVSGWDQNDGGTGIDTFTSSALLTNTWQNILAYYPSASSRAVYVGGAVVGSNTTVATPTQTMNVMAVGTVRTTPALTTRALGDVTFGNGILSGEQIKALAAGRSPLVVAKSQILGYYPLRGTLEDLGPRRAGLQPIGSPATIWTDHPLVDQPPRRRLYFVGGAGSSKALTLADTASTSQAIVLQRLRALTLTGTASTSQTISLPRTRPLTFTGTAATSQSIALQRLRPIPALTGSAVTTQSLSLARLRPITLTGSASTTQSLALGRLRPIALAGTAATTQTVTLGRLHPIPALAGTATTSQTFGLKPALKLVGTASTSQTITLGKYNGLSLAGTATTTQAITLQRSRALALSGTATTTQAAALNSRRALTLSGAAATSQAITLQRNRALVLSGAATTAQTLVPHRIRPLVLSGSAATTEAIAPHRARALILVGTATTTQSLAPKRSRRLVLAGTAATTQVLTIGHQDALHLTPPTVPAPPGRRASIVISRKVQKISIGHASQVSL